MDGDEQSNRIADHVLEDHVLELTLLPSPSRNGSYISLPGTADPSDVLRKLKKIITSTETRTAFQQFAQQYPSVHDERARSAYLQHSILSCLSKAQQRKMVKHTQTLVSVSICCIKHLRTACGDTHWTVDVSTCPTAGTYVVKFPHIEDIGYYTTPEVNLCNLISSYPDHFITYAERIVQHESNDACDTENEQDVSRWRVECGSCACS
jgi:hypothetical protein